MAAKAGETAAFVAMDRHEQLPVGREKFSNRGAVAHGLPRFVGVDAFLAGAGPGAVIGALTGAHAYVLIVRTGRKAG